MISLCSIFSERLQNFTKNLLDYLAATLEKSYKELSKYTSLEDQIFFWKAMENMRRFAKNSFHR